jgi:hypothetical protein
VKERRCALLSNIPTFSYPQIAVMEKKKTIHEIDDEKTL